MSRIGRMPITVPAGVSVEVAEGNVVTVKGPKGQLTRALRPEMIIEQEGTTITVKRPSEDKLHRSLHGLTRTLLHNMVVGVTDGYAKELEVNGVGYRAAKAGKKLTLNLGYSHPVEMIDPEGIEIADRVLARGPGQILPWRMTREDYYRSISDEMLTEKRLKKLDKIVNAQLRELGELLKAEKRAGYQEHLIDLMVKDIKA